MNRNLGRIEISCFFSPRYGDCRQSFRKKELFISHFLSPLSPSSPLQSSSVVFMHLSIHHSIHFFPSLSLFFPPLSPSAPFLFFSVVFMHLSIHPSIPFFPSLSLSLSLSFCSLSL